MREAGLGIGLERIAMKMFEIPDIRFFWSEDSRFSDQFASGDINVKFKPYSKYPPCLKDISFWIPPNFSSNGFCDLIRSIAGDLVESVTEIDKFVHPKTKKESHCYRVTYRSLDRNLTNEEINELQEKCRVQSVQQLKVELR